MRWGLVFAAAASAGAALAQDRASSQPMDLPFKVTPPHGVHLNYGRGRRFVLVMFQRGYDQFAMAYVGPPPGPNSGLTAEGQPALTVLQSVSCSDGKPSRREVIFVHSPDEQVHFFTTAFDAVARRDAEKVLTSVSFADWPKPLSTAQLAKCETSAVSPSG